MIDLRPAAATTVRRRPARVTAYGCDADEADLFHHLASRHGMVVTTTSAPVADAGIASVAADRCISVGHTSVLDGTTLRALATAGVELVTTRSIGVDHIDLAVADELGLTVRNVMYSPDGVADFTLMLILMAVRRAPALMCAAARGAGPGTVRGRDLGDLTVGVVGVGNIGRAVVRRLQPFGCRVLAHTNRPHPAEAAEFVPLDVLLRQSDVVTLHLPLEPRTRHLIGREQLAAMRPGAVLVNTGRGGLVDTEALIGALEGGHLGGAALDVLEGEDEPTPPGAPGIRTVDRFRSRLLRHPDVTITPHAAYRTTGTLHEIVDRTLASCLDFERSRA
ncbi:NAD(P)-dependent oxidoreductase [Dermatobacter hominis]|uniref:NAD(P)-dependent oxidoreductase n=1 Tax=Dermatobacter hominis TaxID=2884263 RepID=UPI001D106769|nr:NAD(P)-dependent oxidoreductase [Dermatobacter hominis]UDY37575.1 D-lactate dehydrogenase VanH-A [Dermatobacter hominis]